MLRPRLPPLRPHRPPLRPHLASLRPHLASLRPHLTSLTKSCREGPSLTTTNSEETQIGGAQIGEYLQF